MAIDILNDRGINSLKDSHVNAARTATLRNKSDVKVATDTTSSSEDVDFTSSAQAMSKGFSIASASDGIDQNKVAKLKSAINDGSYNIDYDKLAGNILKNEAELNSILG